MQHPVKLFILTFVLLSFLIETSVTAPVHGNVNWLCIYQCSTEYDFCIAAIHHFEEVMLCFRGRLICNSKCRKIKTTTGARRSIPTKKVRESNKTGQI